MNRTVFSLLVLLFTINSHAQDVRSQLKKISDDLTKQLEARGKKRVAIAAFLDLQNRETELGRYMADKFTLGISANPNIEVLDRSQLTQLMLENKLGASSILDPKTIPTLGKIAGVEAFITGNYAPLDNSIDLTVKIIDSQRAVRLGGAEGSIPRTSEINKLQGEIDSDKSGTNNNSVSLGEPSRKLPKPSPDCKTKNTCTVCVENKSSVAFETDIYGVANYIYIHPNNVKCWYNIPIGELQDHRSISVGYKRNGYLLTSKQDEFIVEACNVYLRTFTEK